MDREGRGERADRRARLPRSILYTGVCVCLYARSRACAWNGKKTFPIDITAFAVYNN